MLAYTLHRILAAIPTLWVALTVVFISVRVIPGDPTTAIMGNYFSEESFKALSHEMGLDKPLIEQYFIYLWDFCRGDFGKSLITGGPILIELLNALPHTIELTLGGILIGTIMGVPLGLFLAMKRNSTYDYVGRFLSLAGLSFPPFYTAILVILIFAIKLHLLPVTGVGEPGDWVDRFKHLILPSFSLGLLMMSYITRVTRSSVLEVMGSDYVRTAEAKGLRRSKVIFKHVFKNALIPLISFIGLYFGVLIGDSVMTEIVFNRPGLGSLLVGAMMDRDYITITSVMTVYATIVIIINLLTDLCYGFVDPRITYN